MVNSLQVRMSLRLCSKLFVTNYPTANIQSDFASRNLPKCFDTTCQICSFIAQMEESVVWRARTQDLQSDISRLPFASRSAWLSIQSDSSDLHRTHAHPHQRTRPSEKLTNVKDVKPTWTMLILRKMYCWLLNAATTLHHCENAVRYPERFSVVSWLPYMSN